MAVLSTRTGVRFFFLIGLIALLSGCNRNASDNDQIALDKKDSVTFWINQINADKTLSISTKKELLERAFEYSNDKLPDTLKTKKISQISLIYQNLGDTMAFKEVNAKLMRLAEKIGDYQSLGEAHWDLGYFQRLSQPDSAYYNYNKAFEFFNQAKLSKQARDYPGRILYAMSWVKNNNKDYVGAEKDIVQAIDFFKLGNHKDQLFDAYNLLSSTQNGLNNFEKTLEYNEKASEFIQFRNTKRQYRDSIFYINNQGTAYIDNANYQRGIDLLNQVLSTDSIVQKAPRTYAKAMASLANAKFKNGDSNINTLKSLIKKSDEVLDSLGNIRDKARNREFLAEILVFEKDTIQALREALAGKNMAAETNNNDRLLSSLVLLTKIDRKNSAKHAKAYFDLNDSLQAQERNIRDKFARIQLETDEVIEENEQLARRIRTWIAIALGILLLGLAVFIIITQRANNQRLKFKQRQQEANQEIYNLMLSQQAKLQEGKQIEQKRVSEELHDGILGQMLGIRLILSGLNERDDEASVSQRAELIEKLQEVEEEIRTISHELNDSSYQKIHNFILAIDDLVKTIGASAQMESSFSHDKNVDWDALDGETKINIYRIVQECLQNCVKHAQCDKVAVDFKSNVEFLTISVDDNGRGFDAAKGKKGIGMKNILSRAKKMSGSIQVDSKIGKGTKITVMVPIQRPTKEQLETKSVLEV